MFLRKVAGAMSAAMAIDLGTCNTLAYVKGRGIVFREPSVVALNAHSEPVAIGAEVFELLRHHADLVTVVRPLRDGAIDRLDLAEKLIEYCIHKCYHGREWVRPRVAVGVNPFMTQVERHAVESCLYAAGASEVYLVDSRLAAAHGAGLAVSEPSASMIVDIGGATTLSAVVSIGSVSSHRRVLVGGMQMDEAVTAHIERTHQVLIGQQAAERIKLTMGSASSLEEPRTMNVRGLDLNEGLSRSITITSEEITNALDEVSNIIMNVIRLTLEYAPADLSTDIADRGIVLAGGGALLRNLDFRIRAETGLPVLIAENASTCVILGLGKTLNDLRLLKRLRQSWSSWD